MIDQLKLKFGAKCTAISVNKELSETFYPDSDRLKLCEAVNYSFHKPIILTNKNLACPGARRSVGFDEDDSKLAHIISKNTNIPVQFVKSSLNEIPKLKNITTIFLGMDEHMETEIRPDLYIVYVQPAMVTKLIHTLAKTGIKPAVPPFSLLSVCGNVFSHCYSNDTVSLSFGCPESRKYGGIEKNEVVLGFSSEYAQFIVNAA